MGRSMCLRLLGCGIVGVLLALAWPGFGTPVIYPDTRGYLAWPNDSIIMGHFRQMGARPPIYPIFLRLVGIGPWLGPIQTVISVVSWSVCGWVIGGVAGLSLLGTLSLATPLAFWARQPLTESLSFSLLALAVATTVQLAERWSLSRLTGWVLTVCAFCWIRDVNLYVGPFLAAPALFQGRRRAAVIVALCIAIVGVGYASMGRNDRWEVPLMTVINRRVLPNPDALAYFQLRGMPPETAHFRGKPDLEAVGGMRATPGFESWLRADGLRTYGRWLVSRRESYAAPYLQVQQDRLALDAEITNGRWPDRLYALTAPPSIFLLCVLAPLVYFVGRPRQVSAATIVGALLIVATAVQVFICYHGGATEVHRHMLGPMMLYRLAPIVVIFGVLTPFWRRAEKAIFS